MDKKVFKVVIGGFAIYAVFAAAVITFYEDDPDQMNWQDRQAYNKKYINELGLDEKIHKSDVINTLGSPDITEAKTIGNITYQVMFYRTKHERADGMTTKDECTPLLFKEGTLIAWGDNAYNQYETY
jgi:hypothetical protein